MTLWDALRGRSTPPPAGLDGLFHLGSAAITLQAALGLQPTGVGSVCYRAPAGQASRQVVDEALALITEDGDTADVQTDSFGFVWVVRRGQPDDTAGLATDLHALNTSLEEQGLGSGLLCTVAGFADATEGSPGRRTVGLVYLYKQKTFYPFAPTGPQQRDNLLEMSVRDALEGELPIEPDLNRWMALWGAPGL